MAIQISGTTVIDNSRNLTNVESVSGNGIATQAEAEAGTVNNQIMTPLRVSQAISALAGGGMVDDDINWSTCNVGCAVRGGGNVVRKTGGVIWIVAPSTAESRTTWPMGYCNGTGSDTPNKAQRITGRSGWFVPDSSMLLTSWNCRAYWDTFNATCCWWSSTEWCCPNIGCLLAANFNCLGNQGKDQFNQNRPHRIICY